MTATVDGADPHVIIAGSHAHRWRHDVFTSFLRRISVEDVLATRYEAAVPQVLSCSRDFNFKRHRIDGVDVVVGVTLCENGDEFTALNHVRTDHLGRLGERKTVVVHTEFLRIVCGAAVAVEANEAGAKVGGPNVAGEVRSVERCRAG